MSILSHHLTRSEAAELARRLRAEGTPEGGPYVVVARDCYGFVSNVAARLAGADLAERRAIVALAAEVAAAD